MTAGRIRLKKKKKRGKGCRRLRSLGVSGRVDLTAMIPIRHKSIEGYTTQPI